MLLGLILLIKQRFLYIKINSYNMEYYLKIFLRFFQLKGMIEIFQEKIKKYNY